MEETDCLTGTGAFSDAELLRAGEHSRITAVSLLSGEKRVIRQYDHPVTAYQTMLGVHSPCLPTVYSYLETADGCTVEEEFIEGRRLFDLLCQRQPSAEEACKWAKEICAALCELHARGLIHRDVKPENIIIRPDGTAVLLDLDAVSALLPDKDRDTQILGTVGYAAPEQYGFGRSDMRTDIFGIGVLLNILLTGKHPSVFLAEGPLRPIIEKCISVNADSRYGSAAELLRVLETSEAGKPKKGARRWIFGLAAALVCLGAVWCLLRPGSRPSEEASASEPEETALSDTVNRVVLDPPEGCELLQTEAEPFSGELLRSIPFEYDGDGDGKTESYCFAGGLVANDQLMMIGNLIGDCPLLGDNGFYMAPMVWKRDGDRWIPAEEMAEHLGNPAVTLFSLEPGEGMPLNYPMGDLYGVWKGSVYSIHKPDSVGVWVYQFSGEIGGVEYRTATKCNITDW